MGGRTPPFLERGVVPLAAVNAAPPMARFTAPLLTTRLASPHGKLAFFSMFSTFGTPQDITLASLRVEHLLAADEATARVLRERVRVLA